MHPSRTSDAVPVWPVLVVCADAVRVAEVRRTLSAVPLPMTIRVASSAMAAMRLALTQPLRLVVVDWAIDGPGGQALVRQLARLRPTLPVLSFDVLGISGPAEQVQAWPWDELTTVLDCWLLQQSSCERGSVSESPT